MLQTWWDLIKLAKFPELSWTKIVDKTQLLSTKNLFFFSNWHVSSLIVCLYFNFGSESQCTSSPVHKFYIFFYRCSLTEKSVMPTEGRHTGNGTSEMCKFHLLL